MFDRTLCSQFQFSKSGGEDRKIFRPLSLIFDEDDWANFLWKGHESTLDNAPGVFLRVGPCHLPPVGDFVGGPSDTIEHRYVKTPLG